MNDDNFTPELLYQRWSGSLIILATVRRERKKLIDEQQRLFRERKSQQPTDMPGLYALLMFKRLGALKESIPSLARTLTQEIIQHQGLCKNINTKLGAGTIQHWQRARRKKKPPFKYMKHFPIPEPSSITRAEPVSGLKSIKLSERPECNGYA